MTSEKFELDESEYKGIKLTTRPQPWPTSMKFVSLTWMWVSDRGCWVRVLVVMTVEEAGPVGELAPALLGPGGAPVQVGWNDAFGVHDGGTDG